MYIERFGGAAEGGNVQEEEEEEVETFCLSHGRKICIIFPSLFFTGY